MTGDQTRHNYTVATTDNSPTSQLMEGCTDWPARTVDTRGERPSLPLITTVLQYYYVASTRQARASPHHNNNIKSAVLCRIL